MADIDATFSLSSTTLNAGFSLSESNVDAVFNINAAGCEWGTIYGTLSNQSDLNTALTTLQTSITSEATTRANADTELGQEISEEASNREDADEELQEQITANTNNFANYRTSANQDVIDATKQDVISDLSTIRSNATNGQSAYTTQQGYGNIVTHNVSEFATSSQGSLADTALQPNDNISELTNDIGYITASYHDSTKQNVLTAGSNIQITNNTISATDTTYTAGDGLTLIGTQFTANIVNNVTSTDTNKSLSANMGKELQDEINNLKARGRYLSTWNCTTGLAGTTPTTLPYTYKTGDYFIISTVGSTNYKPDGSTYTGTASSTVESGSVSVNDTYYYDGSVWSLLHGADVQVTFSSIAGQPSDNSNLATALNAKQDTLIAGTDIDITNNEISFTNESNFQTGTQVGTSIADNVGKILKVEFEGTLENTIITFEPTTTYTLKENYEYEVDLTFPVSGTLDDNYYMRILNGSNYITFVNALDYDEWSAMTIGDMKQLSRYYTTTGYRWLFRAVYKVTSSHKLFLIYPVVSNDTRKQNVLTAGSNITISGNTISATDTTYTAGTDISIINNTISFTGTIPTKTSDITNDSGFITSASLPTKISDLTDDTSTNPIDKADTLTDLTATVSELNVLDGITATTTELNYCDGVTSNIQTQIDNKVSKSGDSMTGTLNMTGMSDGYCQQRFVQGNYGVMFRQDDTNFYLLLTDSGSPYGTWNSYRPFLVNLATGTACINDGNGVFLKSTAVSGYSGYMVWTNGFCIQWGRNSSGTGTQTQSLAKTYADTKYAVFAEAVSSTVARTAVSPTAVNSITLVKENSSCYWVTFGQLASGQY